MEVPLSLRQIAKNLELNYNTVRVHSSKDSKFPKPFMVRSDGDGTKWFQTEIAEYYRIKPDGRIQRTDDPKIPKGKRASK